MPNFKKNLPNIITAIRIFLVVPILVIMLIPSLDKTLWEKEIDTGIIIQIRLNYLISLVLFVIAALSDFLDGYLARKWEVVSTFGKILDPIADKLLINTIMIVLTLQHQVLIVLVLIMIMRDIIVDALRMHAIKNNIDVAADIYGKMKTVFQMFAICFVLLISSNATIIFPTSSCWWYYGVQNLGFYLATMFSVGSLINYAYKIFKPQKTKVVA